MLVRDFLYHRNQIGGIILSDHQRLEALKITGPTQLGYSKGANEQPVCEARV